MAGILDMMFQQEGGLDKLSRKPSKAEQKLLQILSGTEEDPGLDALKRTVDFSLGEQEPKLPDIGMEDPGANRPSLMDLSFSGPKMSQFDDGPRGDSPRESRRKLEQTFEDFTRPIDIAPNLGKDLSEFFESNDERLKREDTSRVDKSREEADKARLLEEFNKQGEKTTPDDTEQVKVESMDDSTARPVFLDAAKEIGDAIGDVPEETYADVIARQLNADRGEIQRELDNIRRQYSAIAGEKPDTLKVIATLLASLTLGPERALALMSGGEDKQGQLKNLAEIEKELLRSRKDLDRDKQRGMFDLLIQESKGAGKDPEMDELNKLRKLQLIAEGQKRAGQKESDKLSVSRLLKELGIPDAMMNKMSRQDILNLENELRKQGR